MAEDYNRQARFLQRWSERKQASRVGEPASSRADGVPAVAADADSLPGKTPLDELTDADMPPLDSLDEHSDFTGFLSPKVSEALQRQALRKLFQLPSFNATDGLNDYDEDYTRTSVLVDWVADRLAERKEWQDIVADGESAPTDQVLEEPMPDREDESNGEDSKEEV